MKTMLFNPYSGLPRHPSDIASDPEGILMPDPDEPLRPYVAPPAAQVHGELDPRSATETARKMLAYCQSFNGQTWGGLEVSVDRQNLGTTLENLEETAAMLLNMSERVSRPLATAPPAAQVPAAALESKRDHLLSAAGIAMAMGHDDEASDLLEQARGLNAAPQPAAQVAGKASEHPVGASDDFGPDAKGCCGATVTQRCNGCPHDMPAAQPAQGPTQIDWPAVGRIIEAHSRLRGQLTAGTSNWGAAIWKAAQPDNKGATQ